MNKTVVKSVSALVVTFATLASISMLFSLIDYEDPLYAALSLSIILLVARPLDVLFSKIFVSTICLGVWIGLADILLIQAPSNDAHLYFLGITAAVAYRLFEHFTDYHGSNSNT